MEKSLRYVTLRNDKNIRFIVIRFYKTLFFNRAVKSKNVSTMRFYKNTDNQCNVTNNVTDNVTNNVFCSICIYLFFN